MAEQNISKNFSLIEPNGKEGKLFFIRRVEIEKIASVKNNKSGRLFCIAKPKNPAVDQLASEIIRALRLEPSQTSFNYLVNLISKEGYDLINHKFIRFQSGRNKLKLQPEVRGVSNEPFFEDFATYELKVFSHAAKESDNSDQIYFQNLKIKLSSLDGNDLFVDYL